MLNLVFAPSIGALYSQVTVGDFRDPDQELVVEVEFQDFSDMELSAFPDAVVQSIDGYELGLRLSIVCEDGEPIPKRTFLSKSDMRPSREQMGFIGWRYLPANRSTSADSVEGRNSALRALLASVRLGPESDALSNALAVFNETLGASETLNELKAAMAAQLSAAMPKGLEPEELVLETRTAADDILGDVKLSIREGGEGEPQRSIGEQSDGTRSIISMTFYDLSNRAANIVAIDEPENHLHPAAQRTLAELFKISGNQKILATHSTAIVQKFDPECIVAFDRDGCVRSLPLGYLTDEDRLMAQWWIDQRLDPLTARAVLFVEGDSDRIFLEYAARSFGVHLDRIGVYIFDLGGANQFDNAFKIFGPSGFDVRVSGLVDADAAGRWGQTLGISATDLQSKGIFVCAPDLEREYVRIAGRDRIGRIFEESNLFTRTEAGDISRCATDSEVKVWFGKKGRKAKGAIAAGRAFQKVDFARIPAILGLARLLGTA
jgi:putative ATP-dependent endonuclease of OLD family